MYYQKIQNKIVTEQINAKKSSLTQEVVQSNPALAFSAMHSCDMEVKEFIVHSRKKNRTITSKSLLKKNEQRPKKHNIQNDLRIVLEG